MDPKTKIIKAILESLTETELHQVENLLFYENEMTYKETTVQFLSRDLTEIASKIEIKITLPLDVKNELSIAHQDGLTIDFLYEQKELKFS